MKNYPVIKYVVLFIIGIITQHYIGLSFSMLLVIVISLFLMLVILQLIKTKLNLITTSSVLLVLLIMSSGALYFTSRTMIKTEYPFNRTKLTKSIIYGTAKSINLMHEPKLSMIIEVDSVNIKGKTIFFKSDFLCSIKEKNPKLLNNLYDKIGVGNYVKIKGTINKPRGERNPGEFDYYKYLQSKEISALIYVGGARNIKIVDNKTTLGKNIIFKVRKAISKSINEIYNKRTAGLLKGLILADRSEIDYRVKENFINSGVIHVLAVSGLHVGFIVLIFFFLFSRVSIYPRTLLTIIGLIAFLLITNNPPSVFRATIMAVVMLLVFLSNRNYNAVNALAIAALILLVIDPAEIFNPGFQLSFSAVLSILIVYPLFDAKIREFDIQNKFLKYLILFIAVSLAAQLGTLPFTLIYFNKLSIVSLFANLLVIPLIGLIISLGILSLIVGSFWTWAALVFSSANMLTADVLFYIVKIFGELKFSYLFIREFSILDAVIYYVLFLIFIYALKRFSNSFAIIITIILLIGNSIVYIQLDDKELLPDGELSVFMIDIGQGDGILLKFPNGKYGLIDAGNATPTFDNGERVIAPLLRRLGIDKIDYGFISHIDSDHYKGFLYLIANGFISKIYKPKLDTSLSKDVRLEKLIHEKNVELEYYSKKSIDFGNARMYILNDTTSTTYKKFDTNNKSGVFKIVHGNNTFLFVGDAEKQAEKLLVNTYGKFLDVDVLKVGHHGSKTSSSEIFINYTKPDIALISVGLDNKFRHPSKIVIDRYKNRNIEIDRTDLEGAVIYQSDGENLIKINWKDL